MSKHYKIENVLQLLRTYYYHSLPIHQSNEPGICECTLCYTEPKKVRAINYEPLSKDLNLSDLLSFDLVDNAIKQLQQQLYRPLKNYPLQDAWFEYCILIELGLENPNHEDNELRPKVTEEHLIESIVAFCKFLDVERFEK